MADGPEPAFPTERHVLEPDCGRCPALAACRTRISWGTGPSDADVVVVGEAPAAGDPDADRWRGGNLTGHAYTSRHSGRRVRRLLAGAGLDDRTYYTNAVKCFPRDPDAAGETNREPTPAERRNCRTHLRTELAEVRPTVVCPTGKHATASVLALADAELDGFLDAVLEPRPLPLGDGREPTVLPLLHPSYRDVWRARLGYDDGEYVATARETIADLVERR